MSKADFLAIPSACAILNRAATDSVAGVSIVLACPVSVPESEVSFALECAVERISRGTEISQMNLSDLTSRDVERLPRLLLRDLGSRREDGTPLTVMAQQSLLKASFSCDLLLAEGFALADPDIQRAWLDTVARWASFCKSIDRRLPAVGTVLSGLGTYRPPSSDVFLNIYWWWGTPLSHEIVVIARDRGLALDNLSLNLIASLGGGDDRVLEALLSLTEPLHTENMVRTVHSCSVALEETVQADALRRFVIHMPGVATDPNKPPEQGLGAWSQGLLFMGIEGAPEVSSAVLPRLGCDSWLDGRIWRAQANWLMPQLDSARRAICYCLSVKYGKAWPRRFPLRAQNSDEEDSLRRDPNSAQWGYLKDLFCSCIDPSRQYAVTNAIITSHGVRNELMHFRYVSRRQATELQSLICSPIEIPTAVVIGPDSS
jgi:hypothetical protein